MTERQCKIRITKLEKLIDNYNLYREAGQTQTPEAIKIKKKIEKFYNDFEKDADAPIRPALKYNLETDEYQKLNY